MRGGDLATVAWVYDRSELSLLLSLFEHHDIWVVQVGAQHIAIDWSLTVALGGVELRVHAEQAEAARALLAGLDRRAPSRRFFLDNRLLDILLVLVLFASTGMPSPARLPASFVLGPAVAARREP